jgi:glucose dehydrogenase
MIEFGAVISANGNLRPCLRRKILQGGGAALAVSAALMLPLGSTAAQGKDAAKVDGAYIVANDKTTHDWPTYGLNYAETRFSKLDQINDKNVAELGLVWSYSLDSSRGVEATPLVVDGQMYVSGPWSIVHAVDVRTGRQLWVFDPQVPREIGFKGCCDVVNRGVAVHKGKVYVGAFDGRLIAIDVATGKKVWEKDTVIDKS